MYSLSTLGFDALRPSLADTYDATRLGRITNEFGDRYTVVGPNFESRTVPVAGTLRDARPAVGDFVQLSTTLDRIDVVIPRRTGLVRQAAGLQTRRQVIAANVDTVFIVTSMNDEFNESRLERYLAVVWESGARPVLVLNKSDLANDPGQFATRAEAVALGVPVVCMTAVTEGAAVLRSYLGEGVTCVLIGSSAVGKSTIVNALIGEDVQSVGDIREDDDEGRHTTTRRDLIVLPGDGGVLIDTPGMRELQLWDAADGVSQTFDDIEELASACRFRDCSHEGEPGCAIRAALRTGELERRRLDNYHKMQRELAFHDRKRSAAATRAESRRWAKVVRSATKTKW